MPRYEITSPDGRRYEITSPEGATQEQVLAYAQSQFKQSSAPAQTSEVAEPPRSLADNLKRFGLESARGLMTGGPVGLIAGAGKEAMRQSSEALERGAYNAGGAVTDAAAQTGLSPEVSAGAGYLTNVGVQAIPAALGAVAGQAARPVLQAGGRRLMQSALKPGSRDLVSGNAAKAVQTMLDEGVNVTPGGAAQLRAAIDVLKVDIATRVASSPATIGKVEPAKQILQTLDRLKSQVNPGADKAAILKVWDEFNSTFANQIPIQQAQAVKQGTYKVLGERAYSGAAQHPAEVEGQKAIARGLRKAIEQELPAISKLNQQEKSLINALQIAEYRAAQSGNINPGGLAYLASNPKAAVGFLADRSPLFKSIMARLLHNALAPAAPAAGSGIGAIIGQESATGGQY